MNVINELLSCLKNIDYNIFDENHINNLLDSRDIHPFDTEWVRIYNEIETLKDNINYNYKNIEEQDKIKEKVFTIISKKTNSELASYISDDFALIYDSLVLEYKDEWLSKLILVYKSNKIPSGEI